MKNLRALKRQLKKLIEENELRQAIDTLKKVLLEDSEWYDVLINISRDRKRLEKMCIKGVIDLKEQWLEEAKLGDRFLDLVNALKKSDVNKEARRLKLQIEKKKSQGSLLYHIPSKMALNERTTCKVRIAFDKEKLIEGIVQTEDTVIKEDIEVSDKMQVQLLDVSNDGVFQIKGATDNEQFLLKDGKTDWVFYVTPRLPGEHILVLKVSLMIKKDGEWQVNNTIIEEAVTIVTPPLEEEKTPVYKVAKEDLTVVDVSVKHQKKSGFRNSLNPRISAIALLFIMLSSVVTYAAIPAQVEFWAANIQGTPDAYENYIQRWEDASRENPQLLEKAYYQRAETAVAKDTIAKEKALEAYFDKYELQGRFSEKVTFDLAELKQDTALYEKYIQQFYEERTPRFEAALFAVAKIKKDDPTALQRYEAEYGEEGKFAEAIEQFKVERRDSLVAKSIRGRDSLQLQSLRQIYPDIKADTSHIVNQQLKNLGVKLNSTIPSPVIEPQETEKPKTEKQQPKPEQKQEDKTIELADQDQDGVPDDRDKCPKEAGSPKLEGCPDTDGDGIEDAKDTCPNEKGEAIHQGCPDTDGDGIIDKEDLCPLTYGLITMDGCPDSDADGVVDTDDNCPDEKGRISTGGCPDMDDDGVIDSEDECVTQYGPKATNGCPDADEDGIADAKDECPNKKGTIENNGCPKVTPSEDSPSHSLPVPPTIFVPAGTFTMGCLSEERDGQCVDAEKPARTVSVDAFYMGKYEVTVEEYLAFADDTNGNYPEWLREGSDYHVETGTESHYKDKGYNREAKKLPIVGVSWNDAVAYCKWLSEQTGQKYHLASEAEWEYAARGGEQGAKDYFLYSGSDNIGEVAWYDSNSGDKTHEVGKKKANQLGLYDMSGNVYEWCADSWHKTYTNAPKDGSVWRNSNYEEKVVRGGSWFNLYDNCRVSYRDRSYPFNRHDYIGFRIARY